MKEMKVGEEIRIRCVESQDDTCTGCFFNDSALGCGEKCSAFTREDRKNVHFEIVEYNTTDKHDTENGIY